MPYDARTTEQQERSAADLSAASLVGTRRERMQRLQIGALGLGAMILLVGLANIILTSAQQNQASIAKTQPVAQATQDVPAPPRDPLADAGVVPALQSEPLPTPSPSAPAIIELPRQ